MKKQVWKVSGLIMALMGALTLADAGQEKHGSKGDCDGKGERPDREQMMKKYDKDGDGQLSEEERAALRADMGKHHGKRPSHEEIKKKFDVDGDGELNEEERAAMHEAFEARRREREQHGE